MLDNAMHESAASVPSSLTLPIESELIDARNRLRNPIACRESQANRDLRGIYDNPSPLGFFSSRCLYAKQNGAPPRGNFRRLYLTIACILRDRRNAILRIKTLSTTILILKLNHAGLFYNI